MKRIISDVKIIGTWLTVLYATSLLIFLGFIHIPGYKLRTIIYIILFTSMVVASLAVIMLKEWGRKLIVVLNLIMMIALLIPYIPKMEFIPVLYFCLMNLIILLYFSQSKIRSQFHSTAASTWKSVLIVDDDELHVKTDRPILMTNGYSVLSANSGEYGLQIAKNQKPDLILLDVILPGIKGREVCKRLKADDTTKNIPVVFVTSKDSADDIKAEMDVGGLRHLTKPINSKILISTVYEIIG